MANQIQPIFILQEGTQRSTGRTVQKNNIAAARAVAETVRTTLGPKGMDKMLVDSLGDITVTNDGFTILDKAEIEHPAAKMIVEVAKTQQDEVGDGTTTAVIIAGELLHNAEELIEQNIHPTVIAHGYLKAAEFARGALLGIAHKVTANDTNVLKKVVMTAMTGKNAEVAKEHLAEIVVEAARLTYEEGGSPEYIKTEKRVGKSVTESRLVRGVILDKERANPNMPSVVQNAKIALINKDLEIKKTEIDSNIEITSPEQMQKFLDMEEQMLRQMAEQVAKSGANVVFVQKGMDDAVAYFLAKKGIFAVSRVLESDMKQLARATGGKVTSNLKELSRDELGSAGSVIQEKVGEEDAIVVSECKNPKAVTILVQGGTKHVLDEIDRAIEDGIGDVFAVLKNQFVVAGAGALEVELAKDIRKFASSLHGREQLAVEAFAKAIEVVPKTLAENAGLDPIDVLTDLRAAHQKGMKNHGIDVFSGKVVDAWKRGVIEPLKVKTQAIDSAVEATNMILRIDDMISAGKESPKGMPQGMPPGMDM
ncbi:TCP-1/cpn60 chaperonin family protein [Candidatus Woesearchaeota archaeon]|nr:TCP-1/cpn60 chaperonin family protein [Candidatus Woesearchaeota archaeon]